MNILVSNDDGVSAKGIFVLNQALSTVADTKVIAPDRDRSGASNSLTLLRPLRVSCLDNGFYSVDGTPTDCVHLGLTGYFEETFDMVVSGINEGSNLGDDVLYSGTVAAAMEGRNLGLPSIAISLANGQGRHFETAAKFALNLVKHLQTQILSSQTILNINVPDLPLEDIKGVEITRLGTRHRARKTECQEDPRQRPIYWIGKPGSQAEAGPGTDFYAIDRGYVSITPIHLDMTHYEAFDQVSSWIQTFGISS